MVTERDVSYVADLAHLDLTEDERARMLKDLNSILGYIDLLNELDSSAVEPMAQVASRYGAGQDVSLAMRPDEPRPSLPRIVVLRAAPASNGIFFKVPKVIER
jgi:aspartyl-tRNA(Asn)/glutamyl-tRNA(Gln) amidotransferase subunit C